MDAATKRLGREQGSALIMAVIAMLILGVLTVSFSLLANLEARIGINQKEAQQALALAEAGLEHGKNMLRASVGSGNFNAVMGSAAARQLGIPAGGIAFGPGKYWVRADNDCANTGSDGELSGPLIPPLVPGAAQDNNPAACSTTADQNETVVLTAWAETNNGRGRARLRGHYTIGNPWKHSCYDGDEGLCIDDAVGGCNANPCVDPSDPRNPNGPAGGPLPLPSDIRCGTAGNGPFPPIPAADIPTDVLPAMGLSLPCVIYPYYQWALKPPGFAVGAIVAPTREKCPRVTAPLTDPCPGAPAGTQAWDPIHPTCIATPSKCHGFVFFGPGTDVTTLATGANIQIGAAGNPDIGCVGTQNDSNTRPCYNNAAPDSSLVVYSMGRVTITNNVEVQGTVVLQGNGVAGGGANKDFGLTGTNRVTTRPCTAGASTCGYPLAILAYDPPLNAAADSPGPNTSGQSIQLDLSNATSLISGIIFSGGTADFNPLTVDGGLIAWDVNITNVATRITYNPTYGNAAPPPAFTTPVDGEGVVIIPPTWVHCTDYAVQTNGPTACQ